MLPGASDLFFVPGIALSHWPGSIRSARRNGPLDFSSMAAAGITMVSVARRPLPTRELESRIIGIRHTYSHIILFDTAVRLAWLEGQLVGDCRRHSHQRCR